MKFAWLGCLLFAGIVCAGTQDSEFNVNTRYTVETVVVSGAGWTTDLAVDQDPQSKISSILRKDITAIIGEKLNPSALDDIAKRLRKEFHAHTVEHHVLRGKNPDYVQVVFDIKLPPTRFDLSVPKFVYNSVEGWTGAVEGTVGIKNHGFTAGLVSDGDDLAERYTGVVARYENSKLGTDRARLRFQFESYHDQWNDNSIARAATTEMAGTTSGIYRTRQNFEPEVTFVIAKPLTVSFGTSFQRFQEQSSPNETEAANAFVSTVRYHQRLERTENLHDLDANYNLRAATRILGSDFGYGRHRMEFRYMLTHGKTVVIDDFSTGMVFGRAPVFERFVLGNSSTLRGWNKYDLDPLGGNRMVHNSVEYRYSIVEVFYDAGSVWDRGYAAVLRHSVGVGLRYGQLSMAVAFPLKDGRTDPIFMVGMNY